MTTGERITPAYNISGWAALRIVAIPILATVALAATLRSAPDPIATVSTFSTRFLGIFVEAAPFLLLGSLTSGLIEVFFSERLLTRLLPRNRILATMVGASLGFAFPVCECGVVPVTRRLFAKGLPVSIGVAFLLGSPVMNPIVLASTWSAFGMGPVLVGRFVITFAVAVAVGVIFAVSRNGRDILRQGAILPAQAEHQARVDLPTDAPTNAPTNAPSSRHPTGTSSLTGRLRSALVLASDEFLDMGRYLIAGSLLAAGLQTLVSQDVLTALGRGPVTSVLSMQLLAYVLSVCSTVDAFLALSFQGAFTTASILAFLTFGPMVDIKSTLMFLGVFRPRPVIYLIGLPLLMTMAIAIWLNLNVPL